MREPAKHAARLVSVGAHCNEEWALDIIAHACRAWAVERLRAKAAEMESKAQKFHETDPYVAAAADALSAAYLDFAARIEQEVSDG